jgi:hypothetical protein
MAPPSPGAEAIRGIRVIRGIGYPRFAVPVEMPERVERSPGNERLQIDLTPNLGLDLIGGLLKIQHG